MREQNLTTQSQVKGADFDKAIERPLDELPIWFVEMLNARLATKRFKKSRNDTITYPNHEHRAN